MSSDWKKYRLSDVIEIIGGGTPKRSEPSYWNGNIPWLSVADFNNDLRFVVHAAEKITEAGLSNSSTKILEVGDIIISARGTVGCLAQLSKSMAFNQSCYGLRAKVNYLTNDYLYYLVRIKVAELKQYVHGAVFDTITRSTFDDITVRLPSLATQAIIVNTLGALDDKIHLNHQINQTLEQMAQAIFKSWFVDFEPVKAKIAALEAGGSMEDANLAAMQAISGKTLVELEQLKAQSPDQYQQLHTTAQHFPAAMQDSELGEIPEGWEVAKISDFGKVICGKTPSKKMKAFYSGEIPFVKIPDTHGKIFITNTSENLSQAGHKSQQNKLLPAGSIGVSCIATVGQVFITTEPSHTNQQINSIILYKQKYSYYLFFKFKGMKDIFHDYASGGSATLNMNTSTFSGIFIEKPPVDLTFQFHSALAPLMDRILNNQKESETLESLRDALLPKLLSGKIKVQKL